jgi:hypothetical protein
VGPAARWGEDHHCREEAWCRPSSSRRPAQRGASRACRLPLACLAAWACRGEDRLGRCRRRWIRGDEFPAVGMGMERFALSVCLGIHWRSGRVLAATVGPMAFSEGILHISQSQRVTPEVSINKLEQWRGHNGPWVKWRHRTTLLPPLSVAVLRYQPEARTHLPSE